MKNLILIFGLLYFTHAQADAGCEKDMLPPTMRAYRAMWEEAMINSLNRKEPLSGIEYEALMDVNSGLRVKIKYQNGDTKVSDRGEDSYREIRDHVKVSSIIEEELLPDQQKYLQQIIFEPACEVIGQEECKLTSLQKRALKWATVHVVPNHQTYVRMVQLAHEHGVTLSELWDNNLVKRATYSRLMLGDAFAPAVISPLYTKLVGPMIKAGFEARLAQESTKRN